MNSVDKIKSIHLVQIGEIKAGALSGGKTISKTISFEYMGSAEFEFGALGKSLRRMQSNLPTLCSRTNSEIKDKEERSLRIVSCLSDDQYVAYVERLHKLRAGLGRTKERHCFNEDYVPGKYSSYDFWWDIENDVMWSFNKNYMNRLTSILEFTFNYMDEQKKNN